MSQKTLGESLVDIGKEIHMEILTAPDPMSVDWTNIKDLFVKLLQQFGPLLTTLIIGWLTPKTKE